MNSAEGRRQTATRRPLLGLLALAAAVLGALSATARAADFSAELAGLDSLLSAGEFAGTLDGARDVAARSEAAGDLRALATAQLRISDALYYLGRREETLAPMQRALELYRSLDDLEGIGRSYYSLAYYYERTEPQKMIALLEQGLGFAERAGDPRLTMNIANAMGVARWHLGRYDEASAAFERSIAIARELGAGTALASANQNLGLIHLHRGENLDALEHFQQALAELDKAEQSHGVAVVLGNMGNAWHSLRDFERALECYRRAMDIHRRNGYARGVVVQLNHLAMIHEILGEIEPARKLRQEVVALAPGIGEDPALIGALTVLGQLAQAEGDTAAALDHYERALERALAHGDPDLTARPQKNLAALAFARGNITEGMAWLDRADSNAALVQDTFIMGTLRSMRAERLAADGRLGQAAQAYREAIGLHERTQTRTDLHLWQARLAEIHTALGDTAAADQAFRLSLRRIEELDAVICTGDFRVQLFTEAAHIFRQYAVWLARHERPGEAWAVLEQGRARDLSFRLLQARAGAEVTPQEQAALGKLSTFQRRLREQALTPAERQELMGWIAAAESEFDRTRWHPPVGGPGERSRRPGRPEAGTLAVAFSVYEDTLLVLSAAADTVAVRSFPGAQDLLLRCGVFTDLVRDHRSGDRHRTPGRALCAVLLDPELQDGLPARLVLVPDQELWNLPFASLIAADGRTLGEAVVLSLCPSFAIRQDLRHRPPPPGRRILAAAVTRFDDTAAGANPLGRLEAAGQEARMVAGLDPRALLLPEATEEQVKSPDLGEFALLHFATHTLTDPEHPNRASIVLGAGGDQDGYLQAREIYLLPLQCRLAVVSGCRSGGGRTVAGEGLLGLTHALLSAGARSTVLSRWDAADEGAAFFMRAFYAALPGRSVDQALQQAQQACRDSDRWSHPAWWATFFVAGDGGQVIPLDPRGAGPTGIPPRTAVLLGRGSAVVGLVLGVAGGVWVLVRRRP